MDKIRELKKWLSQGYNLVVVRNNQVIYKSKEHGIKSLFKIIKQKRVSLVGTVILDKRVGRAAALLLVLGRVKEVVTLLLSQSSQEILINNQILFLTQETVKNILDEDGHSLCPFEKLSIGKEPQEFYQILLKKYF